MTVTVWAVTKYPRDNTVTTLDRRELTPSRYSRRYTLPQIYKHQQGKNMTNQGTVKWFNATKGFGFITTQDQDRDIFVHRSAVEAAGLTQLTEGQQVQYDVEDGARGPSAVNITVK